MSTKSTAVVPELGGVEIHGMTRSAFIVRGALATGAVYGAASVGPYVARAFAQSGGGDIDILNFALTLEYLEAAFYKEGLAKAGLSGKVKPVAQEIGSNEQEHVDTLKQTIEQLGGKPVASPMVAFPIKDEASFLKLAVTFEDTGVSAYNGAAPQIQSGEVLGAAGAIVQVEARHAAAVRQLAGEDPAPDAFDKTLKQNQVLAAVKPFIKS
jgi:rubrerythrin